MQNLLLRRSKHAAKPFEGRLLVADNSGLKKRMRAFNRVGGVNLWPSQKGLLAHDWFRKLITKAEADNAAFH